MNQPEYNKKFEMLISRLFTSLDFETILEPELKVTIGTLRPDFTIQKEEIKAVVEAKLYRSKRVHIGQIVQAIYQVKFYAQHGSFKKAMLVVSSIVGKESRVKLERDYGVIVWDRSTIFYLLQENPLLRAEFEDFFNLISVQDEEEAFEGIELEDRDERLNILSSDIDPAEQVSQDQQKSYKENNLCKELKEIKAGREYYRDFEEKCEEILKYIFEKDLTAWNSQNRTDDGLNQFDLICRIVSIHDFWRSISQNFNSKYILFEFKNYIEPIKQAQVYSTEKYLFSRALRSIGFIIAKNGADKNAVKAMKGALREHGKLMILLTPEDLCEMLKLKDEGNDPNGFLADKVDDFLITLSR